MTTSVLTSTLAYCTRYPGWHTAFDICRDTPGVGLADVLAALLALTESGKVITTRVDGRSLYRAAS
jgi:hypothetical protein